MDLFVGPKHLYASFDVALALDLPGHQLGSCMHVDWILNGFHYTICNIRWLHKADNAANRGTQWSRGDFRRFLRGVARSLHFC